MKLLAPPIVPATGVAPSGPSQGELYFDTGTSLLYFWSGSAWVAAGSSGGSGASVYTTTIGNGATTTFTITHSLGSTSVLVIVRDASSSEQIFPTVTYTSTSALSVAFDSAPTTNQYTVTVVSFAGVGASLGSATPSRVSPQLGGVAGSATTAAHNDHQHDDADMACMVYMRIRGG